MELRTFPAWTRRAFVFVRMHMRAVGLLRALCIHNPEPQPCIHNLEPRLCIHNYEPRLCIHNPEPQLCVHNPEPRLCIHHPELQLCIYNPEPQRPSQKQTELQQAVSLVGWIETLVILPCRESCNPSTWTHRIEATRFHKRTGRSIPEWTWIHISLSGPGKYGRVLAGGKGFPGCLRYLPGLVDFKSIDYWKGFRTFRVHLPARPTSIIQIV